MKISTSKCLGVALIVGALATWLLLRWFGVGRDQVLESNSYSEANFWYDFAVIKKGTRLRLWVRVSLIGCAAFGTILLITPSREQPNA
jgi:hypothetical protein